jgi:hypothetical protein
LSSGTRGSRRVNSSSGRDRARVGTTGGRGCGHASSGVSRSGDGPGSWRRSSWRSSSVGGRDLRLNNRDRGGGSRVGSSWGWDRIGGRSDNDRWGHNGNRCVGNSGRNSDCGAHIRYVGRKSDGYRNSRSDLGAGVSAAVVFAMLLVSLLIMVFLVITIVASGSIRGGVVDSDFVEGQAFLNRSGRVALVEVVEDAARVAAFACFEYRSNSFYCRLANLNDLGERYIPF